MEVEIGKWYTTSKEQNCLVVSIETQLEPNQALCWVEEQRSLLSFGVDQLFSFSLCVDSKKLTVGLSFTAVAAKLYELLDSSSAEDKRLIAPIESSIDPLPHQLEILKKATYSNSIRYMLADEVGLGKTIEAGLILDELLLRHKIKRILIVVPKGLATQWVLEMRNHFNLDFKFIQGSDISSLNEMYAYDGGLWKQFDRVIVSQDSIKPITSRRGWDSDRIKKYNEERIESLLSANWDLIIIDEAHRLGGSTSSVARYKLGKQLSIAAPRILLLTATPHQGKSDSFFRLLNILDDKAFPDENSIDVNLVKQYVMRTEKRSARNSDGKLLFQPRQTVLKAIPLGLEYSKHKELYEEVSEYVRHGYNQAIRNKKPHIGFLMVLLQRLLSSSINAIYVTLERRLTILEQLKKEEHPDLINLTSSDDDFEELSSEEQQERLINAAGVLDEIAEVKKLLNLASICINTKDDAKAIALEELICEVRKKDKKAKILVFTEFIPTQKMLTEFLEKRNYLVAIINGSMSLAERTESQKYFAKEADILISTDAGGEGLNLQFCHIVVNYDLPWNPMKIEQRIGRVDRIGQSKPVLAYNFSIENSVEYRVLEVLEDKLQLIASEFGVDKTSDVLESDASAKAYADAFTESVMNPEKIEAESDKAATIIRNELKEENQFKRIFERASITFDTDLANSLQNHPFRYWTEMLVRYYLDLAGGSIKETKSGYSIVWPDKTKMSNVSFDNKSKDYSYLSLSDPHVHKIYTKALKHFKKGECIPSVRMRNMAKGLSGYWGLYMYTIKNEHDSNNGFINIQPSETRFIPIFISDNGSSYNVTAEKIWTELVSNVPDYVGVCDNPEDVYSNLFSKAASKANSIKDEITSNWEIIISEELSRLQNYYVFQEGESEKTALDEVKRHRQMKLALYNSQIDAELQMIRSVHPELICVSMLRLEAIQ